MSDINLYFLGNNTFSGIDSTLKKGMKECIVEKVRTTSSLKAVSTRKAKKEK